MKGLLRRGAGPVLMACRSLQRATAARDRLVAELQSEDPVLFAHVADRVSVRELDLASLCSVRKFAEETRKELQRLDLLILNAGLAGIFLSDTLEFQLFVNILLKVLTFPCFFLDILP